MEALLAFGAALLALRLGGALAAGGGHGAGPSWLPGVPRSSRYAIAAGAMAWGAAAGWSEPAFRVYYLFGGLLTAALLGLGSALLYGWRWTLYPGLVYVGLAIGVADRRTDPRRHLRDEHPRGPGAPRLSPRAVGRDRRELGRHDRRDRCGDCHDPTSPVGERADHHRRGCCRSRQRLCGPRRCGKRCFCGNCSTSSLRRFYSPFGCRLANESLPSESQA